MKVGINTLGCDHGRSGVGSFVQSLVRNITPSDVTIELFGSEFDRYTYLSGIDTATFIGLPISDTLVSEQLWHATRYPTFVKKQKYDVVLFPAGIKLLPLQFVVPPVIVMQSILPEGKDTGIVTSLLKMQLHKVPGIIAVSEHIKKNLLSFGISESKIKIIHNGIDTNLFYPRQFTNNEAVLIHPFSIRRPYIIYASSVSYPAKRHIELIKAFEIFKKRTGAPHRLVLAGADGINAEYVHKELVRTSVYQDILLTGYFPHQNLPELYSAADACIFPSSSEGAGLPVLEAMACGVPVCCANSGALPEIAGPGVLFFNELDPNDIADSIEKVIKTDSGSNEILRTQMIEKSLEWVKNFSWKKCAEETISYSVSLS